MPTFPASPVDTQVHVINDITYQFASAQNRWKIKTRNFVPSPGSITAAMLADGSVTNSKIGFDALPYNIIVHRLSGVYGGGMRLEAPATTNLVGNVLWSVTSDNLYVFEDAGTQRGYNINLTEGTTGGGSTLIANTPEGARRIVDAIQADATALADLQSSFTSGLADDSVTNAKLSNMAANTLKGAIAAGDPVDLTPAQIIDLLQSDATAMEDLKDGLIADLDAADAQAIVNAIQADPAALAGIKASIAPSKTYNLIAKMGAALNSYVITGATIAKVSNTLTASAPNAFFAGSVRYTFTTPLFSTDYEVSGDLNDGNGQVRLNPTTKTTTYFDIPSGYIDATVYA